jgi:hypothetical protein
MKKVTQMAPQTSRKATKTSGSPDDSVMLGCYDVWSATPENVALCVDLFPGREGDEKTL